MASKNKIDFNDEEAVLAEMARELDIDPEELSIKEERGLSSFGAGTVYEITIRGGGHKEWNVVENEDTEHELAVEIVKQDLDESPENFESGFIESHIDMDRLRQELKREVLDMRIEDLTETAERHPDDFWSDYEREGFSAPEEDEDGNRPEPDSSQIEELAEAHTKERLRDPMEYLEEISDGIKRAIQIAGIDIDAAAEDAVDTDGAGHFLSSYDGSTSETKNGLVYWRTN